MKSKLVIPPKTALLGKRLYIPRKLIDKDILTENYERKLYKDATCAKCPLVEDRHSNECEVCPAYMGEIVMWGKETIGGKKFITLPPVHLKKPKELFSLPPLAIMDIRPNVKFDGKVKFTSKLYNGSDVDEKPTVNQIKVVKDWMEKKSGIIEVPPRGGKTVIATNIACQLGVKTLIIAHQSDYLRQFYETFVGGKKRRAMTNLKDVDDKYDRIRIIKTAKDFKGIEDVDIVLCNYQKFIRNKKAEDRIKKYLANRTLLIVDEVHQGASKAYARFISLLRCRYRCGLSATPDRKDSRSIIIREYLGETTAIAKVQSLIPEIHLLQTPYKYNYDYKVWVYAMKALAKNEKRNKLIVKTLKKDFKDGRHTGAIIPVDFLEHAKDLQNLINDQMGEDSARIFSAKCDREATLEDFDEGKFKVLIAIRSMIKQGIDLSRPSLLYIVIPMSASAQYGAPMFFQLSHRVATRLKDKPQPIVRLFIDQLGQSKGCFQSLYWNEIYKNSRGKNPRYIIPHSVHAEAQLLSKSSKKGFMMDKQTEVRSIFF